MTEAKPKLAGSLVRRPLLAVALAASAVAPAPAMAAYDVFLKLDNLVGESTNDKFAKWIQLFSYATGFQAAGVVRSAAAAGKTTCSPIEATKSVDRSSPPLLTAVMTGQHFQKAEIDFVRSSENGGVFLKYELQDVIVSSLQQAGAAGGESAPAESVSLSFGKMTVSYYPQKADGSRGDPVVASVNCALPAVQ